MNFGVRTGLSLPIAVLRPRGLLFGLVEVGRPLSVATAGLCVSVPSVWAEVTAGHGLPVLS